MSSFIYLIIGLIVGIIICYIVYSQLLSFKNDIIDNYKKGIDIHNYRELRLIFINQSTKDYVKQQLEILKKDQNFKNHEEEILAAARYMAFKDIEKTINNLEKNSEGLKKKY